jgi:succinate dehydrogenase/fumarate reductase flavoprotein subunit
MEGDAVAGAIVQTEMGDISIRARRGVVLACGGYPADMARRAATFPTSEPQDRLRPILAPLTNSGDGIAFAEAAGGAFTSELVQPAAWTPVSILPRRKVEDAAYPHFVDRMKPGFISVSPLGRRFVNEACSYQDFVPAMVAVTPPGMEPHAYLIGDGRAVNRWGMGFVKPAPLPRGHHIRSGYLIAGNSLEELARKIGVDPEVLVATVVGFNRCAREGVDPEFHRGDSAYDRFSGDPVQRPNPNLGPLEKPPFYAVKMVPGELGTFAGLMTDENARVLDGTGKPIGGLYAAGNDMASIFGGLYPAAGTTLGPGMTFAYIAARHLATFRGK